LDIFQARVKILEFGKKLVERNLTVGTGGNISIFLREQDQIIITPSGIDYFQMEAEDLVSVSPEGTVLDPFRKPTTELELHLALYAARSDINAVVHCHSVFATTLACLGWEVPPFSYLVAVIGDRIPLAPYATFGTRELAEKVSSSLGNYNGLLMENHGQVTVGKDLETAFSAAETLEFLAELYWRARCLGMPRILEDEEVLKVTERFQQYGQSSGGEA